MITKIIEATDMQNWGKFLVAQFDREYHRKSLVDDASQRSLLHVVGWTDAHRWVMDLQTGEGALFRCSIMALASADLRKHAIWVCPLFEPFLEWLYQQDVSDVVKLPELVHLDPAATAKHNALWGRRRMGPTAKSIAEAIHEQFFQSQTSQMFGPAESLITKLTTIIESGGHAVPS